MSTTTLLVEILVVGLIALLSLYVPLVTVTAVDVSWALKLPIFVQFGLLYSIGIIWNRACNLFFELPENLITKSIYPNRETWLEARLLVMTLGGKPYDYVEVLRSFVRISRATSLLVIIHVATFIFNFSLLAHSSLNRVQVFSFYGIFFGLSLFSWFWHRRGYLLTIKTLKNLQEKQLAVREG